MADTIDEQVLVSTVASFKALKSLGDGALDQLREAEVRYAPDPGSNSVAIIVRHLHGNMRSRWSDFLTSDGEKPDRRRDEEFLAVSVSVQDVVGQWREAWGFLFTALDSLSPADLQKTVYIRSKPLTVLEALLRQLSHYAVHVGQIVYLVKHIRGEEWQTLSIPKGASQAYNRELGHEP